MINRLVVLGLTAFQKVYVLKMYVPFSCLSLGEGGGAKPNLEDKTFMVIWVFLSSLCTSNGRGGFGPQTAADSPWRRPTTPEKQTVGTVTTSHKMPTLQALSSSRNASTAKRGSLDRGKAFG